MHEMVEKREFSMHRTETMQQEKANSEKTLLKDTETQSEYRERVQGSNSWTA